MTDQYGRKIKYLRLSVTDLCSCRCVYCMGAEGVPKLPHEAVLSFEDEHSTFEIPVSCFDWAMAVKADTTAMSEAHEIDYTLTFDSASVAPLSK